MVAEVEVVRATARERVEYRRCATDVLQLSKLIGAIGVDQQKVIAALAKLGLNFRTRLWPEQNGFRIHLSLVAC